MTERERLFREVERLSTTDPLTGLSNRRHFDAAAKLEVMRARRYGRPLSAVMMDLDHFKRVNDTFGHTVGDRVLVAVSGLCLGLARKMDLKARLGGEPLCGQGIGQEPGGPGGAADVVELVPRGVHCPLFPPSPLAQSTSAVRSASPSFASGWASK
ncbi:MAG: GGDEF domain-containing protein [Deltaproteobacteria bacterium]|nr:GGDEF domain-containing protein [Deltaproteobacteria bacterium]